MRSFRLRGVVAAAVLALVACSQRFQMSSKWPATPTKLEFNLPASGGKLKANQLRWLVLPDHSASLVQVEVRVEAGSAEDPPGKEGLAHLVEHMFFQQRPGGAGTPTFATLLRRKSVHANAFTSADDTRYVELVRPEDLADVLALEAKRFATDCRTIEPAVFEREREVVRNEARERGGDSALRARLLGRIYGADHPYVHRAIGSDASIAAITLDDVCGFVKSYYAPSRVIVALAGAIDVEPGKKAVIHAFGKLPARTPHERALVTPASFAAGRVVETAAVDAPLVFWAFSLPDPLDEAAPEADLLGDGLKRAILHRFLRDARVIDSAVFEVGGARDRAIVVAVQVREKRDVKHVEEVVGEALDGLPVAIKYVRKFRLDIASELRRRYVMSSLFELESLEGRTRSIVDYLQYAPGQHFGFALDHVDNFDSIMENLDAAGERFQLAHALELVILPNGQPEAAGDRAPLATTVALPEDHDDSDADPAEAERAIVLPEGADVFARARQFDLPNGMHVILQPQDSPLPLVTTRIVFRVGSAHEPVAEAGLAELAAEAFQYGSFTDSDQFFEDDDTAYEVPARTEDYYAVGRDATYLTIRHASKDTPRTLHDLATRVGSLVDPAPIKRLLAYEARQHQFARTPESLVDAAFAGKLWGATHAYARSPGASAESIARIDADDVIAFMRRHYVAANATLIVAGDIDPAALEAGIREEFGAWPTGDGTPWVDTAAIARTAPSVVSVDVGDDPADAEQVLVRIGFPAPAGVDADAAARQVLTRMLELRMAAVRQQLGSSYGVRAWQLEAHGPGAYVVDGRIDAARASESVALMHAQLAALRRGEDFARDFVRARRQIVAEQLGRALSSYALTDAWSYQAVHSLVDDFQGTLLHDLATLRPEEVQRLVERELVPAHEILVVAGPRAQLPKVFAGAGLAAPKL